MDDLEGVLDDSDGHDLLAVVSAVHHEGVDESLDDWALGLSESFNLVSAASMWKILGVSVGAGQVILEGDVVDLEPNIRKHRVCPASVNHSAELGFWSSNWVPARLCVGAPTRHTEMSSVAHRPKSLIGATSGSWTSSCPQSASPSMVIF